MWGEVSKNLVRASHDDSELGLRLKRSQGSVKEREIALQPSFDKVITVGWRFQPEIGPLQNCLCFRFNFIQDFALIAMLGTHPSGMC